LAKLPHLGITVTTDTEITFRMRWLDM